jgi:hypothetical protein
MGSFTVVRGGQRESKVHVGKRHTSTPEVEGKELGGVNPVLELGAGVGIDFAVQANFFESGLGPLHDDDLQESSKRRSLRRDVSLPNRGGEINPSLYPETRRGQAF